MERFKRIASKYLYTLLAAFFLVHTLSAQDTDRFKSTIDTLSSPNMYGRGYIKSGERIAASYIQERFRKMGLQKFGEDYFQSFPIPINTFPGKTDLSIDGQKLQCGVDFILSPDCPGGTAKTGVFHLTKDILKNPKKFLKMSPKKLGGKVVVYSGTDFRTFVPEYDSKTEDQFRMQMEMFKAEIVLVKKLTATMSQRVGIRNRIIVDESKYSSKWKEASYTIDTKFRKDYKSQNVLGFVKGKAYPDSILVIGGHYDHLGMMGPDATFYGANDNASGAAMVLELAEYFSKSENQPDKTIVFMGFGGEEVGLVGSKYFAKHPLVDLKNVNFMLSLDLFGAGSKGITAVNGTALTKQFDLLDSLNKKGNYLKVVKKRKPTYNSDHAPFYAKGVPAFFIYTLGDLTAYHDIYDTAEKLEYDYFPKVFGLLRDFIKSL